jgi:ATP-dependent helicase HrpB
LPFGLDTIPSLLSPYLCPRLTLNLNHYISTLPVGAVIPDLKLQLAANSTVLLSAPPGAGKSTLLPLTLLEEHWLEGKKIIMLEPRRIATKAISARMADMLGEEQGQTVGYRIRFDTCVSKNTRLEVVTEGILTRMLQNDNALENVGLVIFDEFHERNLHADLALALCREAQSILRPDLKILVMSATLNIPQLSQLLKAPVVESQGKMFPVAIHYTGDADPFLLPELTARVVFKALKENTGDVLVFLPGEGEIKKCADLLHNQVDGAHLYPLYGQLSPRDQQLAITPSPAGQRKIVLATSIAETSLTIEGVTIVVDCGFTRKPKFDPASGLSKLDTQRITLDAADQRAGRAGRLAPGTCYRMWTSATHARLHAHRTPEMAEADLASLLLDLSQWGVEAPEQLTWLTPPPPAHLAQAHDVLQQLGAIENNKITAHGKEIQKLPCHPRIAHMLLLAEGDAMKQLGTDIAAILEERDVLGREAGIDIGKRIEALRTFRSRPGGGKYSRIEKNAQAYRRMLKLEADNGPFDNHDAGLLLAYAYPERIACARPGNNAQFQLSNGKIAMAGHADDLAHEPWLAVALMDLRDGMGKIFMAAPLNPRDLQHLVKETETVKWDSRKGGIVAESELRLGGLVLQAKPLKQVPQEKIIPAICAAIASEGLSLLDITPAFEQLLLRCSSLAVWHPDGEWPNDTLETALQRNTEWLAPYLNTVRKTSDLKQIDLVQAYTSALSWEQQQKLDVLAPARIKAPTGSNIVIDYQAGGHAPIMKVRLQEVFGLLDTPTVNNGKMRVVMHLLSPGYKPVQVTTDLKSFWNNLYFEIKKELQRRYPKHAWPDDPLNATPVAKGRSAK